MALSSRGQGTQADEACKPTRPETAASPAAQHQGTHQKVQRGQRSAERSWEGILVKRSLDQGEVHTRDKARMRPSL